MPEHQDIEFKESWRDEYLKWICGFAKANAIINRNRIIVSSDGIAKPFVVRSAWNESAMPNLVNGADLPAIPFRSNAIRWNYKVISSH